MNNKRVGQRLLLRINDVVFFVGDADVKRRKQRRKNDRQRRGRSDEWTVRSPRVIDVEARLVFGSELRQAVDLRFEEHRLAVSAHLPVDLHHLQPCLLEHLPVSAALPL